MQKPSRSSKAKDHTKDLGRRFILWEEGNLSELLFESQNIQRNLKTTYSVPDIAQLSLDKKFSMRKGNVNGAIELLSNNMQIGIIPLNEETLQLIKLKHPEEKEVLEDVILNGLLQKIHVFEYESIDETLVLKAETSTKGGSGPSGLDADGWRKMITSSVYGTATINLRCAIAEFIKKLCTVTIEKDDLNSIQSLTACRLIPSSKNPGLRSIGVGEVLRIAGKVVLYLSKVHVSEAASTLNVCAGQESGVEAAIPVRHIHCG